MRGAPCHPCAAVALAATMPGAPAPARAQSKPPDVAPVIARALAPTGKLRVGVLMVWYFALEDRATGRLAGIVPDLGGELARRVGVPVELIKFDNPAAVIAAFRDNALDVTFIGITADRAAAMQFGPAVIDLQTTYLVPAASRIASIAEVDRPGVRVLVPQRSAQEAYLRKTMTQATLIDVPVETPKQAIALLAAGEADAFSHVVPMLAAAQPALPGSRILPGSYFDVPVAVAVAKHRAPAAADAARRFVDEAKTSGFVRQAIERAGVRGVVVSPR